jgi:TorA maturation chaperone TorD
MGSNIGVDEAFRVGVSRDLALLVAFNDHEPTAEFVEALASVRADDWFALPARCPVARSARDLMDEALAEIPMPVETATLDELAADFAAIYLLHSYRASATESPWLDKDELERQEPMFACAEWYARHGLAAHDRQRRSDDHMVLQLQFLQHLFETPALDAEAAAREAAQFLDAHLLLWIGDFAERVAQRCATPYFCGVVTLTHGYLEDFRNALADRHGLTRPAITKAQEPASAEAEAMRYVPGASPSW